MVVNVPKPEEELLEILSDYGSIFIVACGGCPVGCVSGGQARIDELSTLLTKNKKKVTLIHPGLLDRRAQFHIGHGFFHCTQVVRVEANFNLGIESIAILTTHDILAFGILTFGFNQFSKAAHTGIDQFIVNERIVLILPN